VIHHRAAIREAVVSALIAAGTAAGSRVDEDPYDLIEAADCPHLSVEDESESQTPMTIHAAAASPLQRSYRFIVTASIVQNATAQRARDGMLADVEACLASVALPGVRSIQPLAYTPASRNEGEQRIRIGHQLFEVTYVTTQGDPSTAL
jgi:hypothetical protein